MPQTCLAACKAHWIARSKLKLGFLVSVFLASVTARGQIAVSQGPRAFGDRYDLAVEWSCAGDSGYLVDTGAGPGSCLQLTYDGIPELCGTNVFTGVDVFITESETVNNDGTVTVTIEVMSADGSDLLPPGLTCVSRNNAINPIDTCGCDLAKQNAGGPGVPGDPLDPDLGVSPFEIVDAKAVIADDDDCTILEFDLNSQGTTATVLKDRFTAQGLDAFTTSTLGINYVLLKGEARGACCLPDDSCIPDEFEPDPVTGVECATLGGTYQGDFTTCPHPICGSPVYDHCSTAAVAFDGATPFHTADATTDASVPAPCDSNLQNDIWFLHQATCNGSLTFDTCGQGQGLNTVMEVYRGSNCSNMTGIGCSDDEVGCGQCDESSLVKTTTSIGDLYFIRIDGFGGTSIAGVLNIDCLPTDTPKGACCQGGSCEGEDVTEEACQAIAPGTNWVEGAACGDACLGNCCEADGTCGGTVTPNVCESAGGTYLGNRTCDSGSCVACCLTDGTCRNTTTEACLALNPSGVPNVDDQICAEISCGAPNGSTCTDNADCVATCVGGTCVSHGGNGDPCDDGDDLDCLAGGTCIAAICNVPIGACCEGGFCIAESIEEVNCVEQDPDNFDWFEGELCEVVCTGACCEADGTCDSLGSFTHTECEAAGGEYLGNATCGSGGCSACCLDDGTCQNMSVSSCLSLDPQGVPDLNDNICADITCGATNGNSCVTNADCLRTCVGGTCVNHGGDGDACDDGDDEDCETGGTCVGGTCELPVGACCQGGFCGGDSLTEAACMETGTSFTWHEGELCENVCRGTCCTADGECNTFERVSKAECEAAGGKFIGNGSCLECGCLNGGGPDAYGYTYYDSRSANGQPYVSFDITNSGFRVLAPGGQDSTVVSLLRPFQFYRQTYFAVRVSRHGYVSTDFEDTGQDNTPDCPLPANPDEPADTTGARIYAFHDNLEFDPNFQPAQNAGVFVGYFTNLNYPPQIDEAATVLQWNGVRRVGETGSFNMQLLMLHDSNSVLVTFDNAPPSGGSTATVGIQDEPPGDGSTPGAWLQHSCEAEDCIHDGGFTVRFVAPQRGAARS